MHTFNILEKYTFKIIYYTMYENEIKMRVESINTNILQMCKTY